MEKVIQNKSISYDAIVVGSGISGGWAAKELCEKGLKTLMVERGRPVEHQKDYPNEGVPPWQTPYRGSSNHKLIADHYFVQRECYAFNDANKEFYINDRDYPYSTPKDKPFRWIRGNQVGGKSLLWARQCYRLSDIDFNANLEDGHGVDWPIRYNDIREWYSYVERFAGISGSIENLDTIPDGEFLPAFQLNAVEIELQKRFRKKFLDRHMIVGRCAHLTVPAKHHVEQGRGPCQARNECDKGCSFGAYFSTQSATLPAAMRTKNLDLITHSLVQSVIYDKKSNRASGIRVLDTQTMETREYFSKVIFLCASTLNTTHIMLNSRCETFPNGIANSSGVLGHYLMDHLYGSGASGSVDGFKDAYYSGRRPTGLVIPRFQNLKKKDHDFFRGYGLFGGAQRDSWENFSSRPGFGIDLKTQIKQAGGWNFGFHCSGEMLPRYDNQVSLHPTLKDKWGMPLLHIECSFTDNDFKMNRDIATRAAEILEAIGVRDVSHYAIEKNEDRPFGLSLHEMGTARMGRDPGTSVLNAFNQCHDIPNLFVTDGACMTSSAWQNPSLTYMALTARACHYAVAQLKNGLI